MQIIFGIHSISKALNNPNRGEFSLVATDEGLSDFKKYHQGKMVDAKLYSKHELQEQAKKIQAELGYEPVRVPSQIFLLASDLETYEMDWFNQNHESLEKIIALDQISDVQNGAAILRTAAFYGVQAILVGQEKSFGLTPSFFRISSGAAECVRIIRVGNLSRALKKIAEKNFSVVGLSEHAEGDFDGEIKGSSKICLCLGSEDKGLSHAVMRIVTKKMALKSYGEIKSLNVSVASAIAMERCFS